MDRTIHRFTAAIVMGVSGCGKTTIGRMLATYLGWVYIESDDYHSKEDIQKMSGGIPLTDEDRWPWLTRLHNLMLEYEKKEQPVILACSALKESYRQLLAKDLKNVVFIYLKGDYDLIWERMQQRHHFMKADMLKSQFAALEEPQKAIVVNIHETQDSIVQELVSKINALL
ncbi:MAG TPA: gluconokinase [Pelolinea sp.]|nr:gluconokinase [Pelolinea sp.]